MTSALLTHLIEGDRLAVPAVDHLDALVDDDLHLALWCCYQLHHSGFSEVADDAEWDPEVLRFRRFLEQSFEGALRAECCPAPLPSDPVVALRIISNWAGPSLSSELAQHGTLEHLREFAIHRSAYQLKEADGHTWAIPRLRGRGRAAMIEIQADEYGDGRPGEAHCDLFASAMADLGLRSDVGAYVERLPGVTLATDNLLSMFGLNRRLRGCAIGHLALFEMTSVTPMTRYLDAARRLGDMPALERFYEVHVEADAHHSTLALNRMVGWFAEDEPDLIDDMIFGAAALTNVERRFAQHLISCWERQDSSLRPATPARPLVTISSRRPVVLPGPALVDEKRRLSSAAG